MDWAMKPKVCNQWRACTLAGIAPPWDLRRTIRPADKTERTGVRAASVLVPSSGHSVLTRELRLELEEAVPALQEKGLPVRKRGVRKRAVSTSTLVAIPKRQNQRWSHDLMSDALKSGRRFRVLRSIDCFRRGGLAAVLNTSISSPHFARELDFNSRVAGLPLCLMISDNVLCAE